METSDALRADTDCRDPFGLSPLMVRRGTRYDTRRRRPFLAHRSTTLGSHWKRTARRLLAVL